MAIRTLVPQIGCQALLKKKFLEYLAQEKSNKLIPKVNPVIPAQEVENATDGNTNEIIRVIHLGTDANVQLNTSANTTSEIDDNPSQFFYINDSTPINNPSNLILEVPPTPFSSSPSLSSISSSSSCNSLKRKYSDSINDINIKNILEENCFGEAVLKFYEKNKHLTPRYQRYLVDVLITYLISKRKEFG